MVKIQPGKDSAPIDAFYQYGETWMTMEAPPGIKEVES